MNGSPLSSCHQQDKFITPSRKPTPHHCNADKKQRPFCKLDSTALAPICRNIFEEEYTYKASGGAGVNAKHMR
jgi:hypothetical protein